MSFAHLHVHSYYSFFDSTLSPAKIVEATLAQGLKSVALTDTNSFSGVVEFTRHCRAAGIHPLLGAEVRQPLPGERRALQARSWRIEAGKMSWDDYAADSSGEGRTPSASPAFWQGDPGCRAVLLARNLEGYHYLSQLLTRRCLHPDFELFEELARLPESVLVLSDSLDVLKAVQGRDGAYGQLRPGRLARRHNRAVYDLCLGAGIPLVISCDAKMAEPSSLSIRLMTSSDGSAP